MTLMHKIFYLNISYDVCSATRLVDARNGSAFTVTTLHTAVC
jgi:hypothetical protein